MWETKAEEGEEPDAQQELTQQELTSKFERINRCPCGLPCGRRRAVRLVLRGRREAQGQPRPRVRGL